MTALILERAGEPLHLAETPVPKLQPGEVLVRIAAGGVNPLDGKILKGAAQTAHQPPPSILGLDLAGTLEDTPQASPICAGATRYMA
jgi:NADPH2:quinone reductase